MAILTHADFAGRDALVAQARSARADSYCGCGCATIGLDVDRSMQQASGRRSPISNGAGVFNADGDEVGGIIVFVDDGYLSALEIYSWDDPISPLPPLDRLVLWPTVGDA